MVCKISMKKIALVLLCMTLAFICAQFLIIWYAADDDVDIWNDFDQSQISKVVREEMVQHDDGKFGIPARSDMMHQLQMMELGNGIPSLENMFLHQKGHLHPLGNANCFCNLFLSPCLDVLFDTCGQPPNKLSAAATLLIYYCANLVSNG